MSDSSLIPTAFWIFLAVALIVVGGIILYALRVKGDVVARLTHGVTSFELQAKDPSKPKQVE